MFLVRVSRKYLALDSKRINLESSVHGRDYLQRLSSLEEATKHGEASRNAQLLEAITTP